MSKNIDPTYRTICVVAAVAILTAALPALAHCGKCAVDGLALAKALKSGKVNLATATTLAEATTKGVAVRAMVHKHEDGCFVEVHCMTKDKIMAVQVDCTTGRPGKPAEVKDLESHASAAKGAEDDVAGEAPSEADVQSKLDEVTKATKDGKLDRAGELLSQLEDLKNLSDSLKGKVDAARKALDAAKALSDAKKKLPSLP